MSPRDCHHGQLARVCELCEGERGPGAGNRVRAALTIVRTSLGLCGQCDDDPSVEGRCECAVDMKVCDRCGRGPLNDGGPDVCGEPDCAPRLSVWTVYDRPLDYSHSYVARRFAIGPGTSTPTSDVVVADALDELRARLPAGLARVERAHDDDPRIVESWV